MCAWLAGAVVLCAGASDVSAQALGTGVQQTEGQEPGTTTPRRPYRGLFQGANDKDPAPSLVFNGDLFGAYDDNVLAGNHRPRPTPDGLQTDGPYFGANAGLAYTRTTPTSMFGLQGNAGFRYYNSLDRADELASESLTWTRQIGRYTSLSIGQSFMYTPNYRFSLFPGADGIDDPDAGADTNTDYDLFKRQAYRNRADVALSKQVGPRGTLSGGASFRMVNFVSEGARDFSSYAVNGRYQYQQTQNFGWHAGYGYHQADAGTEGASARGVQNLDIGVDYGRALSFSRRTTLSFSTGTGYLMSERTVTGADLNARLRAIGAVQLSHEMGRTWKAGLAYHRSFQFREAFAEPFMTDAVTASINGLIARRLDFNAGASYANANQRSGTGYQATAASAQLRYSLTRSLAAYARYNYYNYQFENGSEIDDFGYPDGQRHGFRVGLNAYFPLKR